MSRPGVVDIDHGYKQFARDMRRMTGQPHVKVGFLDGKKPRADAGPTNVEIAIWAEFGTRHGRPDRRRQAHDREGAENARGAGGRSTEPSRSFMRSTMDGNKESYAQLAERMAGLIVAGKLTTEKALKMLGEQVAGDIKKKIASNVPPPNAPSTLAAKAPKTHTLVDTGQLAQGVAYEVVAK